MSISCVWVTLTHTMRYHAHYHTAGEGHVYQGRFKSFPFRMTAISHVLCSGTFDARTAVPNWSSPRQGMALGSLFPLGQPSETFARTVVPMAVGPFGQLGSPCPRRARRQGDGGSAVDPGVAVRWTRNWVESIRPSTGPRIHTRAPRTPEKKPLSGDQRRKSMRVGTAVAQPPPQQIRT